MEKKLLLTTKEAIESRRSIRKFQPKAIPDQHILELIDAARLAPSGCNAQPWRFKIVKDIVTKEKLQKAAFNQKFVSSAPVVLIACADIQGYLDGTISSLQDLGKAGNIDQKIIEILTKRANEKINADKKTLAAGIAVNVAIAIEHIILRALDFGLGTCWIRLLDEEMLKEIFGWDDNIYPVALIPIGYPDHKPDARSRLSIEDIII